MKNKRYMSLNNEQHTTLLRCLVEFKNDLVRQGRTADIVDEVILKVMNAPVKKLRVIAVWNGKPSGTKNTVVYANRKNVPVINVYQA